MTTLLDSHLKFGITKSFDKQGSIRWNTKVIIDGPTSQSQLAYWDEQSGAWRLEPNGDNEVNNAPPCDSKMQEYNPTTQSQVREWTQDLIQSEHTEFFRNLDWSGTPLGPCKLWPHALKLYTHMLFSDSRASAIYWGPQRITIYNESLTPFMGCFHPAIMGTSFDSVEPRLRDIFGPLIFSIEKDQRGLPQSELEVPLERNGYMEETWWDGNMISLKDDSGDQGGIYFSWNEVTRSVLQDRRSKMINRLSLSSCMTISSTWHHIFDVFSEFPRDITMAIIYSTDEEDLWNGQLCLQHTIGISSSYKAAPMNLDFISKDKRTPLAALLKRASDPSTDLIVIDLAKEKIDQVILEGVDWQGFQEPSRHIVIIPLRAKKVMRGYIVVGLNPRRDFDTDHEQFVMAVSRQLQELINRVTTEEETQKREEHLKKELSETERRVSRLAEVVPTGIYELAADGTLIWANSQFWDIFEVPPGQRDPSAFAWQDYIHPEDIGRAGTEMGKSLMQAVAISDSLRLKRFFKPPQIGLDPPAEDEPFWIMYAASPHLRPDGTVHSLMGSLTNISHLKWTEQLHFRSAEVARRERQRQEEFIDITSHEMRNPLSAITQCADSVILSLHDAKNCTDTQSLFDIIKLNAEAAESILFCAAHQRRIIDDILTLGKLDSKLLTVSPKAFHPRDLVNQAVQMFGTECEVNNINLRTSLDANSVLGPASTVYGDPSRLMQIMVNLLSNAIKFTRSRPTREITIRLGCTETPPSSDVFGSNFKWYTTGTSRPDLTLESDYGRGRVVYLYYAIVDSGKGIPPQFVDNVFTKFNQAERRTHTEYGGSGLGLYISQELTEMQGGRIGIESQAGVGSTFAFYTKARLCPTEPTDSIDSTSHVYSASISNHALGSMDPASGLVSHQVLSPVKYKVLLVEDNILNQNILTKQLRKLGCTVRVCNHGGEAIDSILHLYGLPTEYATPPPPEDDIAHFDCILMDWEMPVCDGIKASKRIRAIESRQGEKGHMIIGVTANARVEQITKAKDAGMDAVLPKPFRVSELLAKIGELIVTMSDQTKGVAQG